MTRKKNKVWLNIGCGVNLAPGFINIDSSFTLDDLLDGIETKMGQFRHAVVPEGAQFVQADARRLPYPDNFVDYIESSDMIEHIPFNEVHFVLSEMYRVLKPGAEVRIETVNFDELAKMWLWNVTEQRDKLDYTDPNCQYFNLQEVIYGNQIGEGEFHRSAFNPHYMNVLMKAAGFKDIKFEIYPTGCPKQPDMKAQAKWPDADAVIRVEEFITIAKK